MHIVGKYEGVYLHALFLGSKMHCSKCDLFLRACKMGIFQWIQLYKSSLGVDLKYTEHDHAYLSICLTFLWETIIFL